MHALSANTDLAGDLGLREAVIEEAVDDLVALCLGTPGAASLRDMDRGVLAVCPSRVLLVTERADPEDCRCLHG